MTVLLLWMRALLLADFCGRKNPKPESFFWLAGWLAGWRPLQMQNGRREWLSI